MTMGVLRTAALVGTAGLIVSLAFPATHAQALAFEAVGDRPLNANDLAFAGDTLWAVRTDLWRLLPGATVWEEVNGPVGVANYILPLSPDTLLTGGGILRRSVNGGQTWATVYDDGDALFEALTSGTLLAGGVNGPLGLGLAYSHDRGATWHEAGVDAGTWVPFAETFAEIPEGHAHAGRLVAACWAGMSYSDDGGVTWARSSLWTDGGRYHAYSVTVGVDGRIYAAYYEVGVEGLQVAASDDGGETYGPPYRFGVYRGIAVRIFALPGGADPEAGGLVVVEKDGSVWRSDDGAQSWLRVGRVPFEDNGRLTDAVVGPDGRLYVAGSRPGGGEWVFRTTGPVVAAAVETEAAPVAPPVVIGPQGGSFQFRVRLTNQTTQPLTFEAWSAVEGPVSREPVVGPVSVTLPPGGAVVRTLTQHVPANAPPGTYTYAVKAGDFPGTVVSSASFTFEKQAGAFPSVSEAGDWTASGWEEAAAEVALDPAEALGLEVTPNPFRGEAHVALTLPTAAEATVALHDVLGRRVALLHAGPLDAGRHAFALAGAVLPAGVYVVRVAAGGEVTTRTVTRLR